ncbi:hypothetical protein QYM36_001002 [Artemia franciscana]|uniref:Tyrosine-protein kinase n=1 Tax=Artemia franciscana TaxID=6661 RepID=A0AA88IBY1_ARTSF|nr:hypothetical protein QYM36_001002 [Artemia franciscana]
MGNRCCTHEKQRLPHNGVTPVRQDGWAAQTPSQTRANFYQLEQLDKRAKKALMHQHADIIRTPHSQGSTFADEARLMMSTFDSNLHPQNMKSVGKIVIALYSYSARESTDMSFEKGNKLEILDDSDADWWKARNLLNGLEGYIPRNFVAEEKTIDMFEWFFGTISRKDTEKLLMSVDLPRGTFIIRLSEQIPGGFSLSIRDWDDEKGFHVKHYKIKAIDSGGYYISTRQVFSSLPELVDAYCTNAYGLCHRLVTPCPRPKPTTWDLSPETRDAWEISRTEISLIRKLGSGNFGEVWYGRWRNSTNVAVKTLKPGSMSAQAFLREAALMKSFRHPNLITLYAVCSREEPLYIITEYMSKGSLLELLRKPEGQSLTFGNLVSIASQIASGMAYLEARQLIHRDLAARNVLVNDAYDAKICDFGLARVIKDDEYCPSQGSRFPVKWTAPEAALYGRFSVKSDVWSFAILLMELLTYGQVPYPGTFCYQYQLVLFYINIILHNPKFKIRYRVYFIFVWSCPK